MTGKKFIQDPIRLIKLLRKACRQEKGIDYAMAVFHGSWLELASCKQGNQLTMQFIQDSKLKYNILVSQFGTTFIPDCVKDNVPAKHDKYE